MKKLFIILLVIIPAISFSQNKDCTEQDEYIKNDKYTYMNIHTWTDSGCVSRKIYKIKQNEKWVEISECLFNWYENRKCLASNGNEYFCCGHEHLTKPGK